MSYSNMRNALLEFCSNRPRLPVLKTSSVARGGGAGGGSSPPIGL